MCVRRVPEPFPRCVRRVALLLSVVIVWGLVGFLSGRRKDRRINWCEETSAAPSPKFALGPESGDSNGHDNGSDGGGGSDASAGAGLKLKLSDLGASAGLEYLVGSDYVMGSKYLVVPIM